MPDFELERFFARWEFDVPHLLCAADAETWSVGELLDGGAGHESIDDLQLGYTETAGHPVLRKAIADLYDSAEPDDVLVMNSAQEAIFLLANVLCDPGDDVMVVWPAYQSLHESARGNGANVNLVRLRHENDWKLDMDEVAAALTPKTKAVIVNYPHSPTGTILTHEEFARLVDLTEAAGTHLVNDEVYRFMELDESDRLPAAADATPLGISIGALSKPFGLAGLRIGWIATRDRSVLEAAARLKDYTTICASSPSEFLAIAALEVKDRVLERNRSIVSDNLEHLDDFVYRHPDRVRWTRPRSGPIGFMELEDSAPIETFAEDLARREGVLILPGTVFGYPGNHFRVGFGRRDFPAALERFERYLSRAS